MLKLNSGGGSLVILRRFALRACWWLLASGVTLFLTPPACALDPHSSMDGFTRQVWSTENGLPQSSVHAMIQTSDGYLWLGTEAGLARFDGYQFKVFDHESTPALAGDDIRCLFEDRSGALWIGTASGVTRLKEGRARTFTLADGIPTGAVRTIAGSTDGRVWILTTAGLAVSSEEKASKSAPGFHKFSESDGLSGSVLSLAPDASGGMWVGTSRGLNHITGTVVQRASSVTAGMRIEALAVLPGDTHTVVFAAPEGVMKLQDGVLSILVRHESLQNGGVRMLLATRDAVWEIGRNSATLIRSNGTTTYAAGKALPGTQITTALEDRRGAVWIGTNAGVARFLNGRMEVGAGVGGSDLAAVLTFAEDREGNLWVGTETAGVRVLRPRAFEILHGPAERGEGESTSVVQAADGAIWVGTDGAGVTRMETGKASVTFNRKDGLASDTVLAVAAGGTRRRDIWVGTPDGLNVFKDGRWRTFTSADGLGDDLIRSVLPAHDGGVWVGTRHGVTHWKDGHGIALTTAEGLGSNLVGPLMEDSAGDLWIGTSGGLARLHAGAVRNFTVADGLPSDTITTLEPGANGMFWIGTHGRGLARWDGAKFFNYAAASAIPRDIYGLLNDGAGSLWTFSERGISRISIAELDRFHSDPKIDVGVVPFGTSDGLPTIRPAGTGYPSAWKLVDGRLAFASNRGVVVLDPSHSQPGAPPRIVIDQITVDDRIVTPEEMSSLGPGPLHFSFSFAGINLTATQRVQYRYKIEGLDAEWINSGTRRVAYYTNIPHGRYRFLVCARNEGEAWSQPAELPFELKPHVYQTLWFKIISVAALILLGLGLYRLRLHRLQSRFDAVAAERNRIAREIHDTLAQSFVAVSVRLEVMSQLLRAGSGVEKARDQLDQTRTLVRESLDEARRSIWELRSEGDGAQTLPSRLTRLVRETTTRLPDTQLEVTGTLRELPRTVEDELYRIAQEAVSNAVRHSGAHSLRLRLRYELELLSLEIVDDGRGFDVAHAPSREGGHFGLTGMRERAHILGSEVMLESTPGKGTSVRVSVSLAKDSKATGKKA